MTLRELRFKINNPDLGDDLHVCIAATVLSSRRAEIESVQMDKWGVLNIVTGPSCGTVDKSLLHTDLGEEAGLKGCGES